MKNKFIAILISSSVIFQMMPVVALAQSEGGTDYYYNGLTGTDYYYTAPTTNYGYTAPTTNYTYTAPTTDYSYVSPTTNYTYTAPTTNYGYTAPTTNYTYTAPTTNYGYTAPTTNYTYTAPTTDYSYVAPTTNYTYTAPTTNYGYTAPTTNYTYTAPTTNYGYTAPTTNYTYTAPTTNYGYTAPTTNYTYTAPTTNYGYTTPDFTTPNYTGSTYSGTSVVTPNYTTPNYTSPTYSGTNYSGSNYTNSNYTSTPGGVITSIVCPSGSNLINGQCISTVTGNVITVTSCPSGTVTDGSNCINSVNGTVVTVINCPSGMNIVNGQCVNNVNGSVITNINCPSGSILTNGQCVNTINGNIVTNVVCTSGTLVNGQCVTTINPPVTTVNNCPSNTQYVNGTCQQYVNAPVVTYQTCWNGSVIPATSQCPQQYKICANGTSVPVNQACYVASTPVVIAPPVVKFNNVVTSIVTQITNTSGRCNGIGLIANNAQSTGWFEYGETVNLGRTTASAQIGSAATAPFSNVLANLKPTTKYFCRAVMQNQYGVVKGEIVSFVTKEKATTYVKPVVTPVKKPVTKKPVTSNVITCSDGSTIPVKNESAATLINQGEKLVALQIEKTDGKLSSGSVVHYKVSYKNLVDSRLTGVVVKVVLPQEITFNSATVGNFDEVTRTLTLNQDTIDPYTEGTILITGTVIKDAPLGKTIITNVYAVYTVPGTKTQDEVTAYIVGSIVPAVDISNKDTGAKKVVGASSSHSFMPSSLIEWLALLAILFIIFILGRSIYASYKEEDGAGGH